MIKGIIFDLDGVITDTSNLHFKAWRKLMKDNFSITLPNVIEKELKGVSRNESLKIILDYFDIVVTDDEFESLLTKKNKTYKKYLNHLGAENILPGVKDFILNAKSKNIKIALASSSLNAPYILSKLELFDYFDYIVDPTKLMYGKPAPDIFNVAAKGINLKVSECIGIEDSIAGIESIKKSGAFAIAIGHPDELTKADMILDSTDKLNLQRILHDFK